MNLDEALYSKKKSLVDKLFGEGEINSVNNDLSVSVELLSPKYSAMLYP